jgi:hypothetical protein
LGEAVILSGGGIFIVIEAIVRLTKGGRDLDARWYIFVVIGVALLVDSPGSPYLCALRAGTGQRRCAPTPSTSRVT